MIITSIKLTNFQCYGGENKFDFTEGLNLIIGDNTAGKSKLYDAFYWVLHDRIPSYKYQYTHLVKEKFVNENSKSQANDKQRIKAEVELTFKSSIEEFQLVRTYNIWRDGDIWNSEKASKEKAFKKDVLDFKPYEDIDRVKGLIMKETFEKYMWFQGEQIEEVLDFDKPETLKTAIEVLSGVKVYDEIKAITTDSLKIASKELDTQIKRTKDANSNIDKLQIDRDSIQEKLAKKRERYDQCNKEIYLLRKRREDLQRFELESRDLEQWDTQIKQIKKELSSASNTIDRSAYNLTKNLFARYWLLVGSKSLQQGFAEKIDRYIEARQKRASEESAEAAVKTVALTKLPQNTPDARYLLEMLDKKVCYLCNRPFEEHSSEEEHIKLHLDTPKPKTEIIGTDSKKEKRRQEIYTELRALDRSAQDKCKDKDLVVDEIKEEIHRLTEAQNKYTELKAEIERLSVLKEKILNGLPMSGSEDFVLGIGTELRQIDKDNDNLQRELGVLNSSIVNLEAELVRKEKEISDYGAKNLSSPIYQQVTDILKALNNVAHRTRDRVFSNLIYRLETEANKHYEAMTAGNLGYRGRIKLENVNKGTDEYIPKIISSTGRETSALNQANLTLVKLSVIMAIISGRTASNTANLYTLISDAPTSTFSEGYILGFCKRVSEVYGQAIIMTKDFYYNETLKMQVMNEVKSLGNVYIIESSNSDEGREDLASTNTIVKKIK